jgi:hypothetical protein
MEMRLKVFGYDIVGWFQVTQVRAQYRHLMNMSSARGEVLLTN